jgi:mandelate racemase
MLQERFRLLGQQGLVGLAISALDMAAWDAYARATGVSLARALGASGTEKIHAYASLRGASASQIGREAADAHRAGYTTAKVKFGQSSAEDDIIAAVRDAMGERAEVMVDYNQCLSVPDAVTRAARLERHELVWIEEPVRADDYAGHAAVAASARTRSRLVRTTGVPMRRRVPSRLTRPTISCRT